MQSNHRFTDGDHCPKCEKGTLYDWEEDFDEMSEGELADSCAGFGTSMCCTDCDFSIE